MPIEDETEPSADATLTGSGVDPRDKLGVCQWFHYEAYSDLDRAVALLHELGIRHLRTGVSWADFHRPGGHRWYRRQLEALRDFEVLLSVWHTPPSIAEGGTCASPPARLSDYADFIRQLADDYGDTFEAFELWNEPNNRLKWDFERYDPDWSKFGEMVRDAGFAARQAGKRAVLGGMIPVDHHWLGLMRRYDVLDAVDVVAIHGFPDMWWDDHPNWDWYEYWQGWTQKVSYTAGHSAGRPVWITETGLATYELPQRRRGRHALQCQRLRDAAQAPVERVYWYSLIDLDPRRSAIEGFHVDENEYHLGLVTYDGVRKPSFFTLEALLAGRDTGARPVVLPAG